MRRPEPRIHRGVGPRRDPIRVAAWAMLQPSSPTSSGGLTWAYYWVCGIAGMVTAVVYVWVTQYYTEARFDP